MLARLAAVARAGAWRLGPSAELFAVKAPKEPCPYAISEARKKLIHDESDSDDLEEIPEAFARVRRSTITSPGSVFGQGQGSRVRKFHELELEGPIQRDLAQGLKQAFEFKIRGGSSKGRSAQVDPWQLHSIAKEMRMSVDDVMVAKGIFDMYDEDNSGILSVEESEKVVAKMAEMHLSHTGASQHRLQQKSDQLLHSWYRFVRDESIDIDFKAFLLWYSTSCFNSDLLLDDREMHLRTLAKQCKVDSIYVDHVKRFFDSYDSDHSGEVDLDEFREILQKALHIPDGLRIPESRIRFFWSQIDEDHSGKVVFDEFLAFWIMYFGGEDESDRSSGMGKLPFEDFYKSVRRIGTEHLDPPWYTTLKEAGAEKSDGS